MKGHESERIPRCAWGGLTHRRDRRDRPAAPLSLSLPLPYPDHGLPSCQLQNVQGRARGRLGRQGLLPVHDGRGGGGGGRGGRGGRRSGRRRRQGGRRRRGWGHGLLGPDVEGQGDQGQEAEVGAAAGTHGVCVREGDGGEKKEWESGVVASRGRGSAPAPHLLNAPDALPRAPLSLLDSRHDPLLAAPGPGGRHARRLQLLPRVGANWAAAGRGRAPDANGRIRRSACPDRRRHRAASCPGTAPTRRGGDGAGR